MKSLTVPLLSLSLVFVMASCSKKTTPTPPPPPAQPPTIATVDNQEGSANTVVTITGSNFSPTASDDHVFFNGVAATVSSVSATTLVATVPVNAGTGTITVKVGSQTATGPVFTYLPTLAITNLTLTTGGFDATVIVMGTGFSTTTSHNHVAFNGKTATIIASTATSISATVPVGAGTGAVTVSVSGITATGPIFTYILTTVVSTLAGQQQLGYGDGTGSNVYFYHPYGITIDLSGNALVADFDNELIRKVTPDGVVSTFAGIWNTRISIDGTISTATFKGPGDVVADNIGNIYVSELGSRYIRKISSTGNVTTIIGNNPSTTPQAFQPFSIAVASDNSIFLTDGSGYIRKIATDGTMTTYAGSIINGSVDGSALQAGFDYPWGIALDKLGNVFVTDQGGLRKITTNGVVSTLPGFTSPNGLGLAFDNNGNLFIACGTDNVIRKVTPDGTVSVFAGTGVAGSADGLATQSTFNNPTDIAFDKNGVMYISETNNNKIRKIVIQ